MIIGKQLLRVIKRGPSKPRKLVKCFAVVQNSNMSKLGDDGQPIYNEKGKVLKGPNYFKPNLKKFVA